MDNKNIVKLINTKIAEHNLEVSGSEEELDKLKRKNLNKPDITSLGKIGILKDKIIFHRSAIATLQDLLNEVE